MTPPDRVPVDRVTRELRARMTPTEHVEAGEKLGTLVGELDELKDRHKAERSAMREVEIALQRQVKELSVDVASGTHVQSVPCDVVADFKRQVVETIRTDTLEVVESRALTDTDRQLAIDTALKDSKPIDLKRRDDGE